MDRMRTIMNTLVYGDLKTRSSLIIMILGVIAGFAVFISGLTMGNPIATLAAVVLLVSDIGYMYSKDFEERILNQSESKMKKASSKREHLDEILDRSQTPEGRREMLEKEHINPLTLYDQKRLKKVMFEYKVKKEHVQILVDSCRSEKITECPAFLWKDKALAYVLLLEEEPRMVKFSLYDYNELHIKVGVNADPGTDYANFTEKTLLSKMFSPLLPNYVPYEDQRLKKLFHKKNLYGIGPDIFCTSNSVKNILKVLSVNVVLTGSKINQGSYGDYFKRVYISRLMFRDNVFSAPEYKDQVMGILEEMATRASATDFNDNLTQMLLGGLIPQEYADYATDKRIKA